MPLPDITELPHAGRMVLLERLLAVDAEHLSALVQIRAESMFYEAANDDDSNGTGTGTGSGSGSGHVGAWVGIEYMAQAIAAWAGFQSRQRGEGVKIGFLLGTRRYTSQVPAFTLGQQLHVSARLLLQADNGLGSFDCAIHDARTKQQLAQASVSVFQPHDAKQYLEESKP